MMKLMRNIMFLSMVGAQNDFNTKYLDFCLNNQHNSQTVINLRFRNDPMGAAIYVRRLEQRHVFPSGPACYRRCYGRLGPPRWWPRL